MRTLHFRYVAVILLIIILSFHPIENRPNAHGLSKGKMWHRRKDNTVTAKWFRTRTANIPLSSHNLLSQDNVIEHPQDKGLSNRKIHSTLDLDFDSSVDDVGDYLLPDMKFQSKGRNLDHLSWNQLDISVNKEKGMKLKQLVSLAKRTSIKYKLISSLRSLDLKDSKLYPHISNESFSDTPASFSLVFNITSSHRMLNIEHAKLNIFLLYNDDETNGLPLCMCKIQVHELIDSETTYKSAVIHHKTSISQNSWHSIDVTNITNKIQNPALLFLNVSFDCSPNLMGETNTLTEDIFSNRNQCYPKYVSNSFHDNGPILTLFSIKEDDEPEARESDDEHSPGSRLRSKYFGLNSLSDNLPLKKQGQEDDWSSSQTFPHFLGLNRSISRNTNESFPFQVADATSHTLVRRRLRRRARRRGGRNSCRRKELYVDFEKMKWADFILYPRGYQAYQCVGRCYSPIGKYLTPTTHAVIQNLVHLSHPKTAARVCCVPTKLKAISILFYDDDMNLENRDLREMVVSECGCR